MSKGIDKLEKLVTGLEKDYEKALQSEEATQIAYREGYIDGVKRAVQELEEK